MTDDAALIKDIFELCVSQVVASEARAPFQSVRRSAVSVLCEIATRYLEQVLHSSKAYAEHAGKTSVSFRDVRSALRDYGLERRELETYWTSFRQVNCETTQDALHALASYVPAHYAAPHRKPLARLTYGALTEAELRELGQASETDEEEQDIKQSSIHQDESSDESDSDSSAYNSREAASSRAQRVKMTSSPAFVLQDEAEPSDEPAASMWISPDAVPAFVPDFLPPFPGRERSKATNIDGGATQSRAMKRDDSADGPEEDDAGEVELNEHHGDPWQRLISWRNSSLASRDPATLPSVRSKKRARSPPSSLKAFADAYTALASDASVGTVYARPNPKRKRAVANVIQEPLADSLTGSIPPTLYRQSYRTTGWLPKAPASKAPDGTPLPDLVAPAFGDLPLSLSSAVPPWVTPHPHTVAPPQHQRQPRLFASLVDALAPHSPVFFARMLRTGPPAPLDQNGASLDFALEEGQTDDARFYAPAFDWDTKDPTISISRDQ